MQDTHWVNSDEQIRKIWGGNCLINGYKTHSRGVAVLFGNNFEYEIVNIDRDTEGNRITVDIKLSNCSLKLLNIYGPNQDNPAFFTNLAQCINTNPMDYVMICGDFNLVLNPKVDSFNYVNVNNPKSRETLLEIMRQNNLIDIYIKQHPSTTRYTWREKTPLKQARLDFMLVNETFADIVSKTDIKPGYRSDHSIVTLEILINKFKIGKEIWKFNTSLLTNKDYIELVHNVLQEEKIKYAPLVFSEDYLNDPVQTIESTIGI